MNMPDLGKQVGPLPMGAWIAVIGGSLGFMWYSRSKSSSTAPDPTSLDATSADSLASVGAGGYGAGSYIPTDGGQVDDPSSATDVISSNQQWGQKAFAWLTGQGMDGATVDTAIRDYLQGETLTTQQNSLITQALGKFGMAPESLPAAPALPVVPKPTPVPVPAKVPPAKPAPKPAPKPPIVRKPAPRHVPRPAPKPSHKTTYTVRAGDTLSGIAARYPSPSITWHSLYNLNKHTIGPNANMIHPGQVLVIG